MTDHPTHPCDPPTEEDTDRDGRRVKEALTDLPMAPDAVTVALQEFGAKLDGVVVAVGRLVEAVERLEANVGGAIGLGRSNALRLAAVEGRPGSAPCQLGEACPMLPRPLATGTDEG